jgi:exosortase D (VPLPA-CTERM-specific)
MTEHFYSTTSRIGFPLLYTLIFKIFFFTNYQVMVKWWDSSDYNYCYFVPLIAGYLLWERRPALRLPSVPSWAGVVLIGLGIFIYLLGELGGEFYCIYFSSWILLVGLLWLHFGWRKLRAIAFPVCFLLAMFPFPNVINNPLSLHLKLLSSKLGVQFLQLTGVSVFQDGNIIDLGFTKLEVVEACSGLRYLFPLLIVGLLLAAQHRARLWQRGVLVLSALPFSILINSLRLTCIAWLYPVLGAGVVDGAWHDFIGWTLFMVSVGCMLGERWLLFRLAPMQVPSPLGEKVVVGAQPPVVRQRVVWPMALVALLMLTSTAAITRNIDFREQVPLVRPLAEFPLVVGEWQGKQSNLEQVYLNTLKLSDYLLADYLNERGQAVSLYVAYNASQRKGESSHSPATCLPGSGWQFKESGVASLPVGAGNAPAEIKRAFMEKNGERLLAYYWFSQRGRVLTNLFQLKWFTFWDALTKHRTDGALVRLITTVQPGEQPAEADARLQEFAREVGPQLNAFLPGR